MRKALAVLIPLLPAGLRKFVGRRLLGWDIHPTAHVGRSVIRARHVVLAANSSIGSYNLIRGLDRLELGEGAIIATRNAIFSVALDHVFGGRERDPSLVLGDYAMITVGHQIDCSDRVLLADNAVIAGFRTQVLTHSFDLVRDRQMTSPVEIGERSVVMSGCILLCGTSVPARSIVSAGSVVTTRLSNELTFYRGNPAKAVRTLPATLAYFQRTGNYELLDEALAKLGGSRR